MRTIIRIGMALITVVGVSILADKFADDVANKVVEKMATAGDRVNDDDVLEADSID